VKAIGGLVVGVADLLRRPGNRRPEHHEAVLDDLSVSDARVPPGEPVVLDVELQSVNEGIVVTGTISAPWRAECRRCLEPIEGLAVATVTEIFEEEPVEGETSLLEADRIDLEPLVREAVLLELPVAPLCRDDCAGLCPECGANLATTECGHGATVGDDRWEALDQLRFDE
jgi:uncharacterized protein